MTTLQTWLEKATEKLKNTHHNAISQTPRLDAETLLIHTLKISRAYLYGHFDDSISEEMLALLEKHVSQRLSGIPIAYILKEKEFWSLNFKISSAVLIPRPETEHLVETSLTLLLHKQNVKILELGTGSGAIAISLIKERPHWEILASDNSEKALAIARENAIRLLPESAGTQLSFQYSDWFQKIPLQKFSAIISNPPYIEAEDPHLEALAHEPMSALISADKGLADIQKIISKSPDYLESHGYLLLEHGNTQANAVSDMLQKAGFKQITTLKDLAGHDRVTYGKT